MLRILTPLFPDAVEKSDPCLVAFSLSLLDNFLKRPPNPMWAGSGGADFFLAFREKMSHKSVRQNVWKRESYLYTDLVHYH